MVSLQLWKKKKKDQSLIFFFSENSPAEWSLNKNFSEKQKLREICHQ